MSKKLIRNIVLAVVILIVGLVLKNKLSGMATKVEIKEDKTAPLVNVFTASPDTVGLGLELYGKLNAINRLDVLSEVSGSFVAGTRDFLFCRQRAKAINNRAEVGIGFGKRWRIALEQKAVAVINHGETHRA